MDIKKEEDKLKETSNTIVDALSSDILEVPFHVGKKIVGSFSKNEGTSDSVGDGILENVSQAFSTIGEVVGEHAGSIVEGVGKVAGDVISGIGEVVSDIDIDL